MVESLDADLLKDLRGLGKPPTFDGNGAEYQDFHVSFRIHMSHVSSVSQALMGKYEAERNHITLAAVKSLALITKGSVRTLVGSVEESNGAEAWRLGTLQIRAIYTERQYALM